MLLVVQSQNWHSKVGGKAERNKVESPLSLPLLLYHAPTPRGDSLCFSREDTCGSNAFDISPQQSSHPYIYKSS